MTRAAFFASLAAAVLPTANGATRPKVTISLELGSIGLARSLAEYFVLSTGANGGINEDTGEDWAIYRVKSSVTHGGQCIAAYDSDLDLERLSAQADALDKSRREAQEARNKQAQLDWDARFEARLKAFRDSGLSPEEFWALEEEQKGW